MTTTRNAEFIPNCVFIPAHAPDGVTLLMLDGDNTSGEIFSSEAWQNDSQPNYLRRSGQFVNADDSPIHPSNGRLELLPELFVVKIDETGYWLDPVVLAGIKRIFGVYVFDRRQHIHICSISASHELHFLGSQWEEVEGLSDDAHDDLWERIMQGDGQSDTVTYWDKWDIDQMLANSCRTGFLPTEYSGGFALKGVISVTTIDAIEEARESYQASEF